MVCLFPGLIGFSFAAKYFLILLPHKSEQFLRGPELQFITGIHFLYPPLKVTAGGFRFGSESYHESSSHVEEGRAFRAIRCEVSVDFL